MVPSTDSRNVTLSDLSASSGWDNWTYQGVVTHHAANPQVITDPGSEYPVKILVSDHPNNTTDIYGMTEQREGELLHNDVAMDLDGDGEYDDHTAGLDAGTRVNGTYYFTGGLWSGGETSIIAGDSPTSLAKIGEPEVISENSMDLYYNESSGVWHAYFEDNPSAHGCCSGDHLGHATAPSPLGPWTDEGDIHTELGEGIRDPEIIRVGDYYYLFADYTPHHPQYKVQLFRSKTLAADGWQSLGLVTTIIVRANATVDANPGGQ